MPADPKELHLEPPSGGSFLHRRGDTLLLVGLVLYVVVLLVGTVGNLLEIETITSFWLFR